LFRGCPLELWTNSFYAFEQALERNPLPPTRAPDRPLRVLLCSGMGPNKDYAGAIRLFRRSRVLRDAELRIMGFGNDAALARRRVNLLPSHMGARATVLPRLTLDEVVLEYLDSDLVWVHSHQEGFGRSLIEARLCGRPVVASNIAPFRRFADPCVGLYGDDTFEQVLTETLLRGETDRLAGLREYHGPLEAAVEAVLASLGVRVPSASGRLRAGAAAAPSKGPAAPGPLAPQPALPPRPPTRPGS
jgi:glycosyltransferase involved in cell wall biosynthesis